MKLFALALASLLAFGTAAHAADSEDAAARLAAARELLRVSHTAELQEIRIELVIDRAKEQLKQTMPRATDADVAEYAAILKEELERDVEKLVDLRATYYAEHFTAAELKEWTRMMQTGIGQKLTDAEPDIMRDMATVDYLWLQSAMQRTAARLQAAHTNGATHL